jgi:hypothetical protein
MHTQVATVLLSPARPKSSSSKPKFAPLKAAEPCFALLYDHEFQTAQFNGNSRRRSQKLENLLVVPVGSRSSHLDRLRTGPVLISSRSLVMALLRLHSVRELGIRLPAAARIPATRVAALARFAGAAKVSAILRLPNPRRLATLVAFVHCLEANALALEVLETIVRELFGDAIKAVLLAVKNRVKLATGMPCLHGSKRETAALTATPQHIAPTPRKGCATPGCIRPQPALDPATGRRFGAARKQRCARITRFLTAIHKADKKARLRTLKDLDQAAATLVSACQMLLDTHLPDAELRIKLFEKIPRTTLTRALEGVNALIRPADNVYYEELDAKYKTVRCFLPALVEHIRFGANAAGAPVVAAFDWLRAHMNTRKKHGNDAPREVIGKSWRRHVLREDGTLDFHAYTFCVLDALHTALRRRDVFVAPSWRYADPRAGLLDGAEWEATRPIICRTLGLSANPEPTLKALTAELDRTYRAVVARLPDNPAVRFETIDDKDELVLTPFEKLDEPASLVALRDEVAGMLPRVDLPELILEIAARTGFTDAFTHISERTARAADLHVSLCAVLMAEACNTGLEPLIRGDVPALKRDRLSWVDQNYIRDDTLTTANTSLVAAQSRLALAGLWGGGEVASADGMRFVVPVRTVHAGSNPKYFGVGRGVTWYNLISDQFSGLNDITVPGTLRDSLILLAVVLEQQTDFEPTQIMTDTGAYSDVVFGLFRLLGYRFSPRLADVGGTRFWRIDPQADYGKLNTISAHPINLQKIIPHWDDIRSYGKNFVMRSRLTIRRRRHRSAGFPLTTSL